MHARKLHFTAPVHLNWDRQCAKDKYLQSLESILVDLPAYDNSGNIDHHISLINDAMHDAARMAGCLPKRCLHQKLIGARSSVSSVTANAFGGQSGSPMVDLDMELSLNVIRESRGYSVKLLKRKFRMSLKTDLKLSIIVLVQEKSIHSGIK